MKDSNSNAKQNTMKYLGNALKLTIGAGAALGAAVGHGRAGKITCMLHDAYQQRVRAEC